MAKDLLLEIGTEEVPAHVMPGVLAQLKERAEKAFQENHIAFASVRTLGTPRRMALLVKDLAEKQADVTSENRGPSVKIAFDADGKPTKAAQGFARGQHVAPEDLVEKDGYVYAVVHETGKETAELLKTLLPELICALSFPNNMRWGSLEAFRAVIASFPRETSRLQRLTTMRKTAKRSTSSSIRRSAKR